MRYYLKKFRQPAFVTAVFMVLAYGLQVCTSLLQIQVTQSLLNAEKSGFLISTCLLLLTWLLVVLCLIGETIFQARTIRQINNALRADMAAAILRKSHQDYHQQECGEHLSQFTNDVNQISQLAWTPFFELIGAVAQVVFGVLALAMIHWALLAASLVIALVMIFVPRLFHDRLTNVGAASSARQSDGISKIKDLLEGYDVLRFFGKDERFANGIHAASDTIEAATYQLTVTRECIGNGLAYVSALCQVAVYAILGFLILHGSIPLATFMGTGSICAGVYNGLNQISKLSVSFAAAKPYFDKIPCHAGETRSAQSALCPLRNAISVDSLSFHYAEKPILTNASFRFEKGKKYALTGPSGCGKSTLLKLLLGWLPDYTGTIRFDDTDIRTVAPEQLQQQMSYIEQNVFLFNSTIRENITLGESFTDAQLQKAVQDSALVGDLAAMPDGLDTVVGENGSNVSGGQKQRIAIARALIHDRSILLVDEGTSALDAKNADLVEESLLHNPDLTLILISHHLTPERKQQFDHVYELRPSC